MLLFELIKALLASVDLTLNLVKNRLNVATPSKLRRIVFILHSFLFFVFFPLSPLPRPRPRFILSFTPVLPTAPPPPPLPLPRPPLHPLFHTGTPYCNNTPLPSPSPAPASSSPSHRYSLLQHPPPLPLPRPPLHPLFHTGTPYCNTTPLPSPYPAPRFILFFTPVLPTATPPPSPPPTPPPLHPLLHTGTLYCTPPPPPLPQSEQPPPDRYPPSDVQPAPAGHRPLRRRESLLRDVPQRHGRGGQAVRARRVRRTVRGERTYTRCERGTGERATT